MAVAHRTEDSAARLPRPLLHRLEKAEDFPLSALEAITEVRRLLDETERRAVNSAREKGATWDDLAYALGVTRQAVFYRYRNRDLPQSKRRRSASGIEATDGTGKATA